MILSNQKAVEDVSKTPLLSMRGVSKHFGGIKALEDVDLDVYDKEALALLGDNGAGKSTLVKIISGVLKKDKGDVKFKGEPVNISSPNIAKKLGIKTVHQDLALFTIFDVPSNLFAGEEKTKFGFLQKRQMEEESEEILKNLKTSVKSLGQKVGSLSGGQRHSIAIGRGVYVGRDPSIMIMDEPTAGLGVEESENVLELLKDLKKKVSVIFITHNLNYASEVADRALVLANGQVTGLVEIEETTEEELVSMMIGRKARKQI